MARVDQKAALEIFDSLAQEYDFVLDLATLWQDRRWKAWTVSKIPSDSGKRILDLGAGTLLLEERYLKEGCPVVGLDLSGGMLKTGISKAKGSQLDVVNADAEFLPFREGSFQVVVSCYVPKYVRQEVLAKEIARVVGRKGSVILYDFTHPRGILAPFLLAYIMVGLRVAGVLLGVAGSPSAKTFRLLPEIVFRTSWNIELPVRMNSEGFDLVESMRMTGGVVGGGFWRKRN